MALDSSMARWTALGLFALAAACTPETPPETAAPEAAEEAAPTEAAEESGEAAPAAAAAEAEVSTATHRLTEVAPGVYFAQYTVPRFFNSNSLVVVNADDILVVDSHITPATARSLIASIREVSDKPITTLVNTHFHYDHAHGNQAFGDVQIIGHAFTQQRMAGEPLKEGTFQSHMQRQQQALAQLEAALADADDAERAEIEDRLARQRTLVEDNQSVAPVPPDTVVQESMTLMRGDREIQVAFLGRAHTGGDVVVYLPADRLVFTGDMMLEGPSWLGDGHVDEWPATLENLKALEFDTILPGHGRPFARADRIELVQAYYRDLWQQVTTMRDAGQSIGEVAQGVDLTAHEALGGRVGFDEQAVGRMFSLLEERGG